MNIKSKNLVNPYRDSRGSSSLLKGLFVYFVSHWSSLCHPPPRSTNDASFCFTINDSNYTYKASFCELLLMLSMFDSLFLVCTTICFTLPLISSTWTLHYQPHVFPWVFPLLQTALNGSTWSTVAVTLDRFSSVVFPGQRER